MKIYIARGRYGIHKIFTDEKQAELFCAAHDYCDLEEWETEEEKADGEVYYGIRVCDFRENNISYQNTYEQIYSLTPVELQIIKHKQGNYTEYIIPTERAYHNNSNGFMMETIANDFIAKYRAEKERLT